MGGMVCPECQHQGVDTTGNILEEFTERWTADHGTGRCQFSRDRRIASNYIVGVDTRKCIVPKTMKRDHLGPP